MSDHNVGGIGRLKLNLHTALRRVGFDVVRTRPKWPPPRVTGTFPPHKEYWTVGRPENYFIHDGYQHRTEIRYFNDTECTDEWQSEVYSYARPPDAVQIAANGTSTIVPCRIGPEVAILRWFQRVMTAWTARGTCPMLSKLTNRKTQFGQE